MLDALPCDPRPAHRQSTSFHRFARAVAEHRRRRASARRFILRTAQVGRAVARAVTVKRSLTCFNLRGRSRS